MACGCGPKSCTDLDDRHEGPSEDDLARFGGDDRECPHCGTANYYDAAVCGKCGMSITESHGAKPWVLVVAAVVCAALVVIFIL